MIFYFYLSIEFSIVLSNNLSIYLSIIYLSVYLSSTYPSIYHLPIHLSIYISIIYLSNNLFIIPFSPLFILYIILFFIPLLWTIRPYFCIIMGNAILCEETVRFDCGRFGYRLHLILRSRENCRNVKGSRKKSSFLSGRATNRGGGAKRVCH